MNRFKKSIILVVMLVISILRSNQAFAATNEENVIVEDKNIINGGIDLVTPLDTSLFNELELNNNVISVSPKQVEIYIPFQTQINNYYCGPAAAMVVNSLGYNKTQTQMAYLLGTTTNGTNAGNGVANALNSVVAGSRYRFYWVWHNYNDFKTIKNHVIEALSWGNPVMVNTAESPNDVYLLGHDIGQPVYHFGVIADYFDHGNSVTYVDPGYGRFPTFLLEQRVTIVNMSYATGGRGYAY